MGSPVLAGSAGQQPAPIISAIPKLVDLVPLDELQRAQDVFSRATGVASVIVGPDGKPLTRPSGTALLCRELVRPTLKGREACNRSDTILCTGDGRTPVMRRCLAAGLWEGGAGIFVGRHRVGNWIVGQVRDENESVTGLMTHAEALEIDPPTYQQALAQVPAMSLERFTHVCDLLLIAANQLSQVAWANQLMGDPPAGDDQARRQLEAQLRQSQKLQAVGQLAGGIAHDFNNLLTVILGNTALMAIDGWERLGEGEQNLLREIEAAANRAASLTRQLLAFSRRQAVAPSIVDVCAVLRGFEPMLSRTLAANVRLELRLPPSAVDVLIDKGQLEQGVLNLALNAQDAMPRGGALEISVARVDVDGEPASLAPGTYARLRVRDEGVGIPTEHLERIFEPFFTTKEPGHGTGLGLATVFGIVEQASGKVLVESAPGHGATFDVYLPMSGAAVPAAPSPAAVAAGGHETVLVCEDTDPVRQLTVRLLREAGYTVLAAQTGEAALELARGHGGPLHLLVSDVMLPRMNGWEVSVAVKQLFPDIRVLFVSGYAANILQDQVGIGGTLELLEKPYTRDALLARVRAVLDGV